MSTKRTASTAFAGTRMPTWPCNWRNETVGACWSKSWNSAYAVTRPRSLYLPSHWRSFRSTTRHFRLLSKVRRIYSKWVAVRQFWIHRKSTSRIELLCWPSCTYRGPRMITPSIHLPTHPSIHLFTHPPIQQDSQQSIHPPNPSIHCSLLSSRLV